MMTMMMIKMFQDHNPESENPDSRNTEIKNAKIENSEFIKFPKDHNSEI